MAKYIDDEKLGIRFTSTKNLTYNFLKKNFTSFYNNMNSFISTDLPISEKVWLYQNGLKERPCCNNPNCNNKTKFKKFYIGYSKYCCKKCSALDTHKNSTTKKKRLEGIKKSNNDPTVRIEMTNKANETKNNFTHDKKEIIEEKRKRTCLNKFGIDYIGKKNRKIPIKKRNIKKETLIKNIINKGYKFIDLNKNILTLKCENCTCGEDSFDIDRGLFFRRSLTNIEPCINKLPYKTAVSHYELELRLFLDSLNIEYIKNDRTILEGKELDIFIPSKNIAIEFNGLYWHSDKFKEDLYHKNKTENCNKKGVELIHIWEDEWVYKKEICENLIKNKLDLTQNKIWARNCTVKEINNKDYRNFLDNNHLQGYIHSRIKLGLFNNENLVSVMGFGSLRKNLGSNKEEGDWELLRFSNLNNYNIIGGGTKLFKYFIRNYSYNKIISYCDNSKFNGKFYLKNNMKLDSITKPNYYYVGNNSKRLNRWNFRKDILVSEGYDNKLTEREIMFNRGFNRIYDCGNKKFIYL